MQAPPDESASAPSHPSGLRHLGPARRHLEHLLVRDAVGLPPLFRQAVDEVIDAPRTNRFTIGELEKTEKTYLGTKVEILLRDFLKLPKGKILDLSVDGVEVDIKNTMQRAWTIP